MLLRTSLARNRLVNLKAKTLAGALEELLVTFPKTLHLNRGVLLQTLLERERTIPTFLGNGVAIPYVRVAMKQPCLFAVGRCPDGLQMDEQMEYGNIRLIFLFLFSGNGDSHLPALANLTRILHDPQKTYLLSKPQSLEKLHDAMQFLFEAQRGPSLGEPPRTQEMRSFLKESFRLAVASGCTCTFLFADSLNEWSAFANYFRGMKRVFVTEKTQEKIPPNLSVEHVLTVSSYADHRLVQLRSAILLALSRNILHLDEKVCCVGGLKGSDRLDCLLVVNVAEEYRALLNARRGLIPRSVKSEVFERIIAIAHEIALEGREGHPIGTMFVVGNHEKLKNYYRPLVLNPFQGYSRDERNMLNPFMDETVKEFAALDGAFVIDGDGVLEAAGVMVQVPDDKHVTLQGGLGTRHTAAAAFTKAHDCLAIVISQSNGQISLFRNGQMLPLAGKIIG
jgi:DNA integrity scanning protein DisA with diadenylate cyclase activity/mannitol/fructose-specific phosphotransferase system IIA component